MTRQSNFDVT